MARLNSAACIRRGRVGEKGMHKAFDLRHPFFLPVWRRILTVALVFAWAVVEFTRGALPWAVVFGLAGCWCVYQFFVVWQDPEPPENQE